MDYSKSGKYGHRHGCVSCLRSSTIVADIVLIFIGAAVIGVFVWLQVVEVDFVSDVVGNPLVPIADYLMIAGGGLLIIGAIVGLTSACSQHPRHILAHFFLILPVLLAFLTSIVCALVFRTWLTDQVRYNMRDSIRNNYGVNQQISDNWDKGQTKWKCCGFDDQSWYVYKETMWYREQPGTPGDTVNPKPYVPASCCVRDADGQISKADRFRCQNTAEGPPNRSPGDQYAGSVNTALTYRGCYEAARDYMVSDQFSWFIIIICSASVASFIVLIACIIALAYYCSRRRQLKTLPGHDTTGSSTVEMMQLKQYA